MKRERTLTFLLIVEAAIFIFLLARSFGKQDIIQINSASGTLADSSAAQENGEEQTIFSKNLSVKPTAYDVTVKYTSVTDMSDPDKKSHGDVTGSVSFSLDRQGIWSNPLYLTDGLTEGKTRIWAVTWTSVDDLEMDINYGGKGQLTIKSVTLRENMIFRFTKLIGIILLSVLVNLVYMFFSGNFFTQVTAEKKMIILALTGTVIFSSLLALGSNFYRGDDLIFHLHRIVSLSDALKSGNIPQRIQLTSLHGYGYASPLFYGEIFLLIPASLYLACIPLQMCYQIYVILINLFTCLITYWCIKKIVRDKWLAVTGSFLYTCSAYRLTNVYQRCAVGEYTAMAFLPLVFYGFYHLYMKQDEASYRLKDYLPLVLGLSGVIQTHTLSVEMTAVLVFVFLIFHLRQTFRVRRFLALLKTVILTFLLNAWFIVPMAYSLRQPLKVTNREPHIGGWTIDPARMFSLQDPGGHHLTLGFSLLIGIVLYLVIRIQHRTWKIGTGEMQALDAAEGLGILTVFFVLPYCQWDNIYNVSTRLGKVFGTVQFTWRFFEFASVLLVFGLCMALVIFKRNTSSMLYRALMIGVTACTVLFASDFMSQIVMQGKKSALGDAPNFYCYYMDNSETNPNSILAPIGIGDYVVTREYMPANMDPQVVNQDNITAPAGVKVSSYRTDGNTRRMYVRNKGKESADIIIPLMYYYNYHAYLDDGSEAAVSMGEDKRVQITIPANYSGTVSVRYIEPVSWRLSEIITLLTVASLVVYAAVEGRRNEKE